MTNVDAPDNQRATVAASALLASPKSPTAAVTVTLAPNVKALWIFGAGVIDPPPSVQGVDSFYDYPTFWTPWAAQPEVDWFSVVCFVSPELDSAVTITWPSAPSEDWWVVADTGDRFTLDAAQSGTISQNGTPAPETAAMVAGWDGTDLRFLLTDNTGALKTVGSSFPPVFAARGAALPADALLVGGSDGTLLRPLAVNTSGQLVVVDQTLASASGAPGTGVPADTVSVAGTDGANLRVLAVDTTGHQLTIDQNLKLAIAAAGAAVPADAVVAGGSDGTDVRALRTDQQGILYAIPSAPGEAAGDHPLNELQYATGLHVASNVVAVAAPGAGKRIRVFYASVLAETSGQFAGLFDTGPVVDFILAGAVAPTSISYSPSGTPLSTNGAIETSTTGGDICYTLVYTVETV